MTWTRAELDSLIAEFEQDLLAYKQALDSVQRRRLEVEDTHHAEYFSKSSGCQAVTHVLIMNIASTEGLIEDLKRNKEELPPDRPALQLVKEA